MDALTPDHGLTYEETPVIEPIPPSPEPKQSHNSFGKTVGMILLFSVFFIVGVGLSVVLREFMGSRSPSSTPLAAVSPTPTSNINTFLSPTATPAAADPYDGWRIHEVISGTTKQPVPGISFKLPPDMLVPICDGASCASQGTYLPNGSRFTVAPRGKGQLLVDARGNVVVTDSSGKSFTTKQVTLTEGRKALEYSGLFSGTTVGGYTFSQMRGVMLEIDEDESLEMNHFTPSGVTAEFAKDDVLFDKIVASLMVARFPQATTSATAR